MVQEETAAHLHYAIATKYDSVQEWASDARDIITTGISNLEEALSTQSEFLQLAAIRSSYEASSIENAANGKSVEVDPEAAATLFEKGSAIYAANLRVILTDDPSTSFADTFEIADDLYTRIKQTSFERMSKYPNKHIDKSRIQTFMQTYRKVTGYSEPPVPPGKKLEHDISCAATELLPHYLSAIEIAADKGQVYSSRLQGPISKQTLLNRLIQIDSRYKPVWDENSEIAKQFTRVREKVRKIKG